MTAYFVSYGSVKDPAKLVQYIAAAAPIVESFGGRFVAASDQVDVLAGEHPFPRIALFEFPNKAACRAWYESPQYRLLWPLRTEAADFTFLVFDGGESAAV